MGKSVVFMFSGQGSQYYQMGRELFEHHPVFRKWMLRLNDVVVGLIGESVVDQVYARRPVEQFNRTLYSHPAIFMVEYSLAQTLMESGISPDYVLGTSLGEFASAALADVMKAEELLEVIVKQAEYFETYCEPGGMIAIIHDAQLYHEVPLIRENSELASVNYDEHFVISGQDGRLREIIRYLKQRKILHQSLPVTYGFHSSYIDPAAVAFKNYVFRRSYQLPRKPFISSLHGASMEKISHDYFWDVVRMPIQFSKAIQKLESGADTIYLDLGPGGTLANFAKRNMTDQSNSRSYTIITPFHQELKNLLKIKEIVAAKTIGTA